MGSCLPPSCPLLPAALPALALPRMKSGAEKLGGGGRLCGWSAPPWLVSHPLGPAGLERGPVGDEGLGARLGTRWVTLDMFLCFSCSDSTRVSTCWGRPLAVGTRGSTCDAFSVNRYDTPSIRVCVLFHTKNSFHFSDTQIIHTRK